MKTCVVFLVLVLKISGFDAFIIPDELPSLLSVIYSNIPTIKKGTDSRLGWGFRLGDRADFQVLLELGPQTNTQPLANQGDSNTNNKRNTLENLANTLYAQRQKEKKEKLQLQQLKEQLQNQDEVKQQDNEASTWLKTWSKDMRNQNEEDGIKTLLQNLAKAKPGLAEGEIDAKSVIPEDESGEKKPVKKRAEKVKSTTEGALDDVNLD